jgi:UDPglucose 6-dehydrogenase/GDP-mannose 6-dehydrogenase
VDADQEKIARINQGVPPIYERDLEELLRKNLGVRLQATTNLRQAVLDTEISMIAVGTPFAKGQIDLRYIREVSRQMGQALREKLGYHVVIVKSTVVPGTTNDVVLPLLEEASGKTAGADFGVGMNPEFLTEGEAIRDFLFPDRIVLGAIDARSLRTMEELYAGFEGVSRLATNPKTAEMIKYTSNCLLATMISFANEIANMGAALGGIDVADVMKGVHLSRYLSTTLPGGQRIAPEIISFLVAGCGFGGSCLPKDIQALIAQGKDAGQPMRLLEAVRQVNEEQPHQILRLLQKHFSSLRGLAVAVLGLAFRPDTNDMRESPAIPIIRELLAAGATLKAYDPAALEEARQIFPNGQLQLCDDLAQAVRDVQAIVLVTRWEEFRLLPELLKGMSSPPVFIDGRRMLEKSSFQRYEGIGL